MDTKVKRTLIGTVVSNARDKSITVLVERKVKHPLYHKIVNRSNKVHAHDEENQTRVGDVVKIVESAPISKTKHWQLLEVVTQAVEI